MLLARLGLRCGEVAALSSTTSTGGVGEIVIRGKGSRVDRLPLPCDVGEAVVDYLCHGRPRGFGRTVFLRSCAPLVGLSSTGVSCVVLAACERAGIGRFRAHRLRHTVASELLRRGAGLPEIGQVLRHQSLQTTAIYAKVDRSSAVEAGVGVAGERVMSALREAVKDYLAIRRALGYELERHGRLLPQFIEFLEAQEATVISTAWRWRGRPSQRTPVSAGGASALRSCAASPGTCRHPIPARRSPPPTCCQPSRQRAVPYLYSEAEIERLMAAARTIRTPLRAATYETLIGLLASPECGSARRSCLTAVMSS